MTKQTHLMDLTISNNSIGNDISSSPLLGPMNNSLEVQKLKAILNKTLRIEMSDGRVLIGIFLCTDADANVILGSCSEYLPKELSPNKTNEEPRMLGLVMVPGKHIITVSKDLNDPLSPNVCSPLSLDSEGDVI